MKYVWLFIVFCFSCKVSSFNGSLYDNYMKIDSGDLCGKITFYRSYLNTQAKQEKNYSDFVKILSDIEKLTGIFSTTNKGFTGVNYLSDNDIKNDIKAWEKFCKQ